MGYLLTSKRKEKKNSVVIITYIQSAECKHTKQTLNLIGTYMYFTFHVEIAFVINFNI